MPPKLKAAKILHVTFVLERNQQESEAKGDTSAVAASTEPAATSEGTGDRAGEMKKYVCEYCDTTYPHESLLCWHMKVVHKIKVHEDSCIICQEHNSYSGSLSVTLDSAEGSLLCLEDKEINEVEFD